MICLDNTDVIEGGAATDAVIEYTMHGLVGSTFTQLAAGVMNTTLTAALYTAGAAVSVVSIILVNTHTSAVAVTLRLDPADGGNPRYIIPKTISLGAGHSLHTDGARFGVYDQSGNMLSVSGGAYLSDTSLADDASITLDTGKTGWGEVMAGDNEEYIEFRFTAAGIVTVISNSAKAVNADTDGNLCVYDAGSGIAIKNRLGATKTIRYVVNYS